MVRSSFIFSAIYSLAASVSAFTPQQPIAFSQRQIMGASTSSSQSTVITSLSATFESNTITMMPPAVIDRPGVKTGESGPAILDRPAVEKTKEGAPVKERKSTGSEAWEVRIFNDGTNTREFVARCLVQITGLSEITAYQTMMQAHQNGVAVVGRYVYEIAEMYHNALKSNGIICDLVPVDEDK